MPNFDNLKSIGELFVAEYQIVYVAISAVNALLLLAISYKFLQIMQQSGYEGFGYFKWLRRRDNVYLTRLTTISLLSLLGYLLTNLSLAFSEEWWVYFVGFAFYAVFIIGYLKSEKKRTKKVPLVRTARMNRLIAVYFFVLLAVNYLLVILLSLAAFLLRANHILVRIRLCVPCLMPIAVPFLVLVAYYIMKPYENSVQKNYIKKCMARLYERPDLIKIGITGSYGKTSVKEILKTLLEEKYEVLATPSSFNTPMGICKTVKRLNASHQVFIAEMGARHVGDIRKLAEIVRPDYAVINGIVGQHLETFGSLSAIRQTKYELVESMPCGTVAYTVDNDNTNDLFDKCKIKCVGAGLNLSKNPQVYATDVKSGVNGSEFILHVGENSVKCVTSLLGEHNVSNICLAAAIAHEIGLDLSEICAGVSRLRPVVHRLEVRYGHNGITVIDDSYNSNVCGIEAALKVLSTFEGRKIVVTPGLVELGRVQDLENYKFGKKLAEVCDVAVLVGRTATYRIQDGLIDGYFDCENVIVTKDLDSARKKLSKLLKSGDVVLFENDLPDKFS